MDTIIEDEGFKQVFYSFLECRVNFNDKIRFTGVSDDDLLPMAVWHLGRKVPKMTHVYPDGEVYGESPKYILKYIE